MLSAIITTLLIGIVLLIIMGFIVSAIRERRRQVQQALTPANPLEQHVTMVLQVQEGMVVGMQNPTPGPSFSLPSSWYSRHRTFVSLCFLLMLLLALFVQTGAADGTILRLTQTFSFLSLNQASPSSDIKTFAHPLPATASSRIVRVDSAARNQYYTEYQYQVWSFASCSGISMEEVMNAYGRHLIAADVLQVEQNLGVWDSYNGLTGGEAGIARAAAVFGFKADPNPPRTLQSLIDTANKGYPVIVGIPGHILVVRGGDNNVVYLVDSAPANRTVMTHAQFLSLWNNFSVLLTPR